MVKPAVRSADEQERRLLIVGWNRKVPSLLREFERYGADAYHIDVVSARSVPAREAAMKRLSTGTLTHVRQIEASYTTPGVLEGFDPTGYDSIVMMASEASGAVDQADANTIYSSLMLRGILDAQGPDADLPDVLIELMDEDNLFMFKEAPEDVIVSPLLVSYMLSQVSLRRELGAVFEELSRPWGAQIMILPARDYVSGNQADSFQDLEDAAAALGEIALGVWCAHGPDAGLALNPDRSKTWTFAADDKVVVLTTYAEPDAASE